MGNIIPIFANPGQSVSITVQVVDGYGERSDISTPQIMSVYFPDRSIAQGFPTDMVRLETGLYSYNINIPQGIQYIGTFIVSTKHTEIDRVVWNTFLVNVARPFGNASASPL